jgi:hypothetical protein
MSSKKKGGVQEGQLAKMLERQRVQQAAADTAKKLADAAAVVLFRAFSFSR